VTVSDRDVASMQLPQGQYHASSQLNAMVAIQEVVPVVDGMESPKTSVNVEDAASMTLYLMLSFVLNHTLQLYAASYSIQRIEFPVEQMVL